MAPETVSEHTSVVSRYPQLPPAQVEKKVEDTETMAEPVNLEATTDTPYLSTTDSTPMTSHSAQTTTTSQDMGVDKSTGTTTQDVEQNYPNAGITPTTAQQHEPEPMVGPVVQLPEQKKPDDKDPNENQL